MKSSVTSTPPNSTTNKDRHNGRAFTEDLAMFKFFVVVMLCVIALHACAADAVVYIVNNPLNHVNYILLINDGNYYSHNLPFNVTDKLYTRIW